MITQGEIVLEFFKNNENKNVLTPDVVDWVTVEYKKRTGKPFRDPDRQIRKLYSDGILQKIKNGCYRYDPNYKSSTVTGDSFTQAQREVILEEGNYRCCICGVSEAEGAQLHVDHVVPRSKGGRATVDNGQVLCSLHNNMKKNYGQTETCKRMYKILYKKALNLNDIKMLSFLQDIMEVYDKHNINSHINWDQNDRHLKSTDIRKSTKTKEASIKKAHSTKDLADSQRSIQK
ncbi:MAG: HNH endonuclease signature motif containing protein [Bacteroidetes bacterium]|nr:HNH endonuclease signature motif containing protein [Bacteroidota bacterium]